MFIAMNRFQVKLGQESEFERVWRERDILLREEPGFVEFHLLKGPLREDHRLYSSHTIWSSKETFEGWTKSDAFRKAHQNAGAHKGLYIGGPSFEGFEVVQHVK